MNTQTNNAVVNGVSITLVSYLTSRTMNKIVENNDLMALPNNGDRMASVSMVADIVTDSVRTAIVARGNK